MYKRKLKRATSRVSKKRRSSVAFRGRYASSGAEMKYFDTLIGDQSLSATTGLILAPSLNLMQQGNGETDRIGRKCVIQSVHIKMRVRQAAATSTVTTDNLVRIMVYHDKQSNGGPATAALLLTTDDILSFRNLQTTGRFRILYDTTRAVYTPLSGNGTASVSGEKQLYVKMNKKCNIPLEFDASTGAISDLTTNNIGIAVWIQDTAPAVVFQVSARVRFSDGS